MALPPDPEILVRPLDAAEIGERTSELSSVLSDCVADGASVGFMLPFSADDAKAYWAGVGAAVGRGERVCLAALVDGIAMATAQLHLATPQNQPHRAEVTKLLVHRTMRGRGLGAALMRRIEVEAALHGRTLLTLDTALGGEAERLYVRLGWHGAGLIPGYALWPAGGECDTVLFWKRI